MYDIVIGRNEKDRSKYGKEGTIFLGKHYVKMGQTTSLSNEIFMDVTRSHVVFVCGKRGCLIGNTRIFTSHGFKEIREFDDGKDEIYSYNIKNRSFMWEKAKLLKYPIRDEKLIRFDLIDGQSITATSEHPLLISDGKQEIWKKACNINKEDKVVAVTKVPEVSNDKESVRIARLLGFLLADGTMNIRKGRWKDGRGSWYNGKKRRLRIFNNIEGVLRSAKEDLEKEFNIIAKRYKRNDCNCEVIETKQGRVVDKFKKLGVPLGKKSHIIRVPRVVWESSDRFKANFLKALFSCDGFVSKKGSRIMYYSNSRDFLLDLHLLLAHFKVQSKTREKKTTFNGKKFISYLLDIMDYESIQNFKNIGFFDPMKTERVNERKFWKMKRRKNTIYLNDNLFALKIDKISKLGGINEVYDLNVPKNHSFIANGIVSHNSGKSYTMGVIAEGMSDLPEEIRSNLAIVMLDTMGIYWTMKYANDKEAGLLKEWGLEGKELGVKIYTPAGYYKKYKDEGVPTDFPFSIKPSELDPSDWCMTFNIDVTSPEGVLIERMINDLKEKSKDYSVEDIVKTIKEDDRSKQETKDAVENRFLDSERWGIFSEEGTPLNDLVKGGQVTVLDVSCYATTPGTQGLRALVIGLVAEKLFVQRMIARKNEELKSIKETTHFMGGQVGVKQKEPLVWLVIDEAHEFLPNEGETVATHPLVIILREGRQPGISLILASQQPGRIHTDVMTQSDIVIAHRITAKVDIEALGQLMQSYMREGLDKQLNVLPRLKGSAIVFDDTNERMYSMRVRPRFTWHGGEAPSAMHKVKKVFDF